jgi:hypothetical protein
MNSGTTAPSPNRHAKLAEEFPREAHGSIAAEATVVTAMIYESSLIGPVRFESTEEHR